MARTRTLIVTTAIVLILAALALQWWTRSTPVPTPPTAPGPTATPAASATASAPIRAAPVPPPVAPPLPADGIDAALAELLGRKAVLTFVQTADFPRRLVATIDNLGRLHAPLRLWPVNPAPGRFTTAERNGGTVIAADNARRYDAVVAWLESIDPARATRLYARIYPLLQQAWRDLGYPKGQFNDRLIEVLDQLLATPAATEAMAVRLTQVKGPIASTRPWVRYEFVDPTLESLTAGQKMLLRVGPAHQKRLKAVLTGFRRELIAAAPKR